jgi:hypothetical protein
MVGMDVQLFLLQLGHSPWRNQPFFSGLKR